MKLIPAEKAELKVYKSSKQMMEEASFALGYDQYGRPKEYQDEITEKEMEMEFCSFGEV